MPFDTSVTDQLGRTIVIEPEYGYGWLLVGKTPEPTEVAVPEPFDSTITDVLSEGCIAHCIVAECDVRIANSSFSWLGLMPRTDSEVDLMNTDCYCKLILSEEAPMLAKQNHHPELIYMRSKSKVFVRGSARVKLQSGQ